MSAIHPLLPLVLTELLADALWYLDQFRISGFLMRIRKQPIPILGVRMEEHGAPEMGNLKRLE